MLRRVVCCWATMATLGLAHAAAPPLPAPPETATGNAARVPAASRYEGVGSCAAIACHGGPPGSEAKWKSAYSVWVTQDRHARAYAVLFEEQSLRMVQTLKHLANVHDAKP